jgi:hypothetical protein
MATPTTKTVEQQNVLAELESQRVQLARVKRRQLELIDEHRQIGARKPAAGLIGAAVERRQAVIVAGVRDDVVPDTTKIDAEIRELEDHRDEVAAKALACRTVVAELAEARRHTLLDRTDELMLLAREKADEGEALIAVAQAAAARLEQHRAEVLAIVNLAVTGSSDDIDERRAAGAQFSPWVVPRDGDTEQYWAAASSVARGPAKQ